MATVLHDIRPAIRQALRDFAFVRLFNELGWDHLSGTLSVEIKGASYRLEGVAQKRGFQVFHVLPGDDGAIPDQTTRRAIDRETAKRAQEHLLIFTDAGNDTQIWQ
ncbi:MAG TPA: hypothetical protein VFU81_23530, partial [Thermomicrobiales bacterium]|nr:hypothetical protein [Thermomicrobiales bacterium]